MTRIDWHLGLQKTGTSSIQVQYLREGSTLDAAGIDWLPSAVGPGAGHHNAAWEAGAHKRHRPELPGLGALLEAASRSTSERLLVSSEDFGIMPPGRVRALAGRVREAGRFEVVPLMTLRNPLDWAESLFAQAAKQGRPGTFPAFAARLRAGGRLSHDEVLRVWTEAFGPARTLVYEEHADIGATFADALGVLPEPPGHRHNRSLNERFVTASIEIRALCAAGDLKLAGRAVPPERDRRLAKALLRAGMRHEPFSGSPVFLGRAGAQAFLDDLAPMTDALAEAAGRALPPCYRAPAPERREPQAPTAEDMDWLMERLAADPDLA